MRFRHFILNEADPIGGPPPGGPPMGGPPPGGPPGLGGPPPGGPPGLGGPPMGGPPGLGAPPMGGPPMGGPPGAGAAPDEPPTIPKHANVWDVLDHILNKKPLEHEKKLQAQSAKQDAQQNAMSGMMDPTAMMGGPALMS